MTGILISTFAVWPAPADELENTTRLFLLGPHDGAGELDSCIITEWLVPDAENHVIDIQDAIGG